MRKVHSPERCSAVWGVSKNNRKARFYSITKSGRKQLHTEAQNGQRISSVIGRVLSAAAVVPAGDIRPGIAREVGSVAERVAGDVVATWDR